MDVGCDDMRVSESLLSWLEVEVKAKLLSLDDKLDMLLLRQHAGHYSNEALQDGVGENINGSAVMPGSPMQDARKVKPPTGPAAVIKLESIEDPAVGKGKSTPSPTRARGIAWSDEEMLPAGSKERCQEKWIPDRAKSASPQEFERVLTISDPPSLMKSLPSDCDDGRLMGSPFANKTCTTLKTALTLHTANTNKKSYRGRFSVVMMDTARRMKEITKIRKKETRGARPDDQRRVLKRHRCEKFWHCLEDPESGGAAKLYASVQPAIVMLSVLLSLAQTSEPPLIHGWGAAGMEATIEVLFILEFCVRFFACPNWCVFMSMPFNVIDLLAGLILFFRIFVAGLNLDDARKTAKTFLFIFVPILRMIKSLRRFHQLHLIYKAFYQALEALPVLVVTLMFWVLFFSSLIFLVEPRDNIDTLPKAMWLTIVTTATVGYGDVSPVSAPGYLVTAVLIIFSVLYMAMPIGIVGQTFGAIWHDRHRILLLEQTRKRLQQWGYTAEDIPIIFGLFDEDLGGAIELSEFRNMMAEMGIGLKDERIVQLFESLDSDSDGGIDAREFVKCVFPNAFHKLYKLDTNADGKTLNDMYVPRSGDALRNQFALSAAARQTFAARISKRSSIGESEGSSRNQSLSCVSEESDEPFGLLDHVNFLRARTAQLLTKVTKAAPEPRGRRSSEPTRNSQVHPDEHGGADAKTSNRRSHRSHKRDSQNSHRRDSQKDHNDSIVPQPTGFSITRDRETTVSNKVIAATTLNLHTAESACCEVEQFPDTEETY